MVRRMGVFIVFLTVFSGQIFSQENNNLIGTWVTFDSWGGPVIRIFENNRVTYIRQLNGEHDPETFNYSLISPGSILVEGHTLGYSFSKIVNYGIFNDVLFIIEDDMYYNNRGGIYSFIKFIPQNLDNLKSELIGT